MDLFGEGTGYVPQMDRMMKILSNRLPDFIFDYIYKVVLEDARKQGIDLDNPEDDSKHDALMETVGELAWNWVEKIREAAAGGEDELHYNLLPF
ncbi:MAG: hypothetical protein LC687_00440 [Actinobacteria bacterium]|nr:hypothetical protein [Actinomycetota bacterium]